MNTFVCTCCHTTPPIRTEADGKRPLDHGKGNAQATDTVRGTPYQAPSLPGRVLSQFNLFGARSHDARAHLRGGIALPLKINLVLRAGRAVASTRAGPAPARRDVHRRDDAGRRSRRLDGHLQTPTYRQTMQERVSSLTR